MRLIALAWTGLVTLSAFARIVPQKDPLNGVLDAQLVVIVRPCPSDNPRKLFRIDKVLLGDAKPDDVLDLGDFQLSRRTVSRPSGC